MDINQRLKRYLGYLRMDMRTFMKEIGATYQIKKSIETEQNIPSTGTLIRISDVFQEFSPHSDKRYSDG